MSIILPRLMPKGMNKGAYRGKLTCPVCKSSSLRRLENIGAFRIRYRCRKCGLPFQYDVSGSADPTKMMNAHPYAAYKKKKWQDIVALHGSTKRRKQ